MLMLPWDVLRAGFCFKVRLSFHVYPIILVLWPHVSFQALIRNILCENYLRYNYFHTFIHMYILTVRSIYYPYMSPHISSITSWSDISGAGCSDIYRISLQRGSHIKEIRKVFIKWSETCRNAINSFCVSGVAYIKNKSMWRVSSFCHKRKCTCTMAHSQHYVLDNTTSQNKHESVAG